MIKRFTGKNVKITIDGQELSRKPLQTTDISNMTKEVDEAMEHLRNLQANTDDALKDLINCCKKA